MSQPQRGQAIGSTFQLLGRPDQLLTQPLAMGKIRSRERNAASNKSLQKPTLARGVQSHVEHVLLSDEPIPIEGTRFPRARSSRVIQVLTDR